MFSNLSLQAAFVKAANTGGEDIFADLDADDDIFAAAARPDGTAERPAASERDHRNGDQRPAGGAAEHGGVSTSQPAPSATGHAGTAEPAAEVDYSTWPVKELKRFLTERGEVGSPASVRNPQLSAIVNGCREFVWLVRTYPAHDCTQRDAVC